MALYFGLALAFYFTLWKKHKVFFYSFFFLLLFFAVFRDTSVGSDNFIYAKNYSIVSYNSNTWSAFTEMEPAYCWLMAFCKQSLGMSYVAFMRLNAFVALAGFFFFIKKSSVNMVISLFFFYMLTYYTASFNIMRQFFALGLYLFFYSNFFFDNLNDKRKIIIYEIITVLIAFGFQKTLLVLTILPVFNSEIVGNITRSSKIQIFLWGSFVVGGFSDIMVSNISGLSHILSFLGDRYVGYITVSANSEKYSILSSLMDTTVVSLLCYSIKEKRPAGVSYYAVILGVVVANVFGGMSALFLRVATNLNIFRIILFPYAWYNSRNPKFIKVVLVVYASILFFKAIIKNFGIVVPYTFWGG